MPILSIDCGTQSLKAIIFSSSGEVLDKAQIRYEPYVSEKPGWAEQDPEIYWQALCDTCSLLNQKNQGLFSEIAGVGITSIRNSMVNVDRSGLPLRPVITWLDQRQAKSDYTPKGFRRLLYRAVGMEEVLKKAQTDGKCNWLKQYQPEVWKKTHKYLQVSGFINFRLTGNFIDSTASQIGYIPFNYKKMRWCRKNELNAMLFPVEEEKLPKIMAPGGIIGEITHKASEQTRIPRGVPVIACGSDKGCETIGMGVIDTHMANLSFGTTASVQTTSDSYFEPRQFMPPYPAPVSGRYNPEIEIFRGYWMITWFKDEFAYKEVLEAGKKGVQPEVVLNSLLKEVPAGSMGLTVQPFWGGGLKQPSAKGAMIGFGGVHTKAHIYRAVIEGLGYALLDGLRAIEKAGRTSVKKVAVSGGASQSDEICQITADIFDLPLVRGKTHETSGLGAAIVTSVGLGIHQSFETAIDKMVRHETVFEPIPENTVIYRKLYNRVYKKMYPSLSPLYKEIRSITGYPDIPVS